MAWYNFGGNLNPVNYIPKAANWFDKQAFGSGPTDPTAGKWDPVANQALSNSQNYSAMDALKTSAGGLFDQFQTDVGQKLQQLGGQEVGAGRFGSGYAIQDSQNTQYNAEKNLNDQIAQMSLNAENLTQNVRQQQQGTYLDILSGQRDYSTAAWNARNQQRGSFWGGLASLGGKAIGAYAGGGGG